METTFSRRSLWGTGRGTIVEGPPRRFSDAGISDMSDHFADTAVTNSGQATEAKRKNKKIALFGHFGQGYNFGNESTLQAILYHLRRLLPDVEITCICTGPEATAATHNIAAVPISAVILKRWIPRNALTRLVRKVFIGIPTELYRWPKALWTLKGKDMLIVPGTGLLTDAYGLFSWGPYNMFKWSLMAKICRCKLLFVSVGAGPIYGALGRWLIKSALSLADFRSYRDNSTLKYLKGIGFPTNTDRVYPDLVFSLPKAVLPHGNANKGRRPVVGLGVMEYAGKYSVDSPRKAIYLAYLENLRTFVRWLLAHEYDVRLLIGDLCDRPVTREFGDLLKERSSQCYEGRIVDEPVFSVEQLLSQLAATDVVVATRFHNVLFALLLNKPVIAISFHHKCVSLMSEMGLSEYCQDINQLRAGRLIDQFCNLEQNAETIRPIIRQKSEGFRKALDEQYNLIFKGMCPG
jgi:polysaccharide pyruvyl transferase WcaK-like protein